jgi:hypothetical protein
MLLSCHQNAGQNHDVKIGNRSSEGVAEFRYMITVTNKNLIQEEIKGRWNLGNACNHLVQNLLPFHLLSKNIRIRTQNYNFASGSVWM